MTMVTFGQINRLVDGDIQIPFTTAVNIYGIGKSNFSFTNTRGNVSDIADYEVYGQNSSFDLLLTFEDNKVGFTTINVKSAVYIQNQSELTTSTLTTNTPVTVGYDTTIPFIQNYLAPDSLSSNTSFDCIIGFNVVVSELGTDDFIFEGINPGTPILYKSDHTGTWSSLPSLPDTFSADETMNNGWSTAANPTRADTDRTKLDEAAQYYALRFPETSFTSSGIFNLTLRDKSVRGPDGSSLQMGT